MSVRVDPTVIGTVRDVRGPSVGVELAAERTSGLTFVDGHGYSVGQVGSFVKIPVGFVDLFGVVSQVGASAVPEPLAAEAPHGALWMTVQLVGEARRGIVFQRGLGQYPTFGDPVHFVTETISPDSSAGKSSRDDQFGLARWQAPSPSPRRLRSTPLLRVTRQCLVAPVPGSQQRSPRSLKSSQRGTSIPPRAFSCSTSTVSTRTRRGLKHASCASAPTRTRLTPCYAVLGAELRRAARIDVRCAGRRAARRGAPRGHGTEAQVARASTTGGHE